MFRDATVGADGRVELCPESAKRTEA